MYMHSAIQTVISAQWFMKSKRDSRAYNHMVSNKSVALQVLAVAGDILCVICAFSLSSAHTFVSLPFLP